MSRPNKVAWERRYDDDSGVESAVRYDDSRGGYEGKPVVQIEHVKDTVYWPVEHLDWLLECLISLRDEYQVTRDDGR